MISKGWLACYSPVFTCFLSSKPRYWVTVLGIYTKSWGPVPAFFHEDSLSKNGCCTPEAIAELEVAGKDWVWLIKRGERWKLKKPPLSRWRIRLPWANAWAMSREGAWQLEWTLFAWIMALKDSKASVANRMAGPNHRIWSVRCKKIWNFGLLNHYCQVNK